MRGCRRMAAQAGWAAEAAAVGLAGPEEGAAGGPIRVRQGAAHAQCATQHGHAPMGLEEAGSEAAGLAAERGVQGQAKRNRARRNINRQRTKKDAAFAGSACAITCTHRWRRWWRTRRGWSRLCMSKSTSASARLDLTHDDLQPSIAHRRARRWRAWRWRRRLRMSRMVPQSKHSATARASH